MDMDLTTQLLSARMAGTQQAISLAVLKKNHEMEMSMIQMLDQAARPAPPAGQGARVDKVA